MFFKKTKWDSILTALPPFVPELRSIDDVSHFDYEDLAPRYVELRLFIIEYEIFGEGSHISTNQRRESTVFSLLIG